MKKALSLILAALLLASSMTACGNTEPKETTEETKSPVETTAPDTASPATDPVATDTPAPEYSYDTSLITENGLAKAHIVVAENASGLEKMGAEELAYHIQKRCS